METKEEVVKLVTYHTSSPFMHKEERTIAIVREHDILNSW